MQVQGKYDARAFITEQMTRTQGLKLKRLSEEAYQPAQYARDLSFTEAARRQGAVRLKAITSLGNKGSAAFHRSLGFDVRVERDYNGPGEDRVVFSRTLS